MLEVYWDLPQPWTPYCVYPWESSCLHACTLSQYILWSFEFRSSQLQVILCQIFAKCCQLTQNMRIFFQLHVPYVVFYMYSFPIQNQPPRLPTNFLAGKLCQPPCRNARQLKSSNPRSNKQTLKTPNFAPYGQWTYMWRPHKRTNTIWHVQLSFPIQTNLQGCQTNFPAGKLCKPPCRNARQPNIANPRSNKQTNYNPNFAPYGQWTYIWGPHKRTKTIWHVQLPYPKPTSDAAKLTFRPGKRTTSKKIKKKTCLVKRAWIHPQWTMKSKLDCS